MVLWSNFALLLTIQFASLISLLINIISLLLTTLEFFIFGGLLLGRIQGDGELVSLSIQGMYGYICYFHNIININIHTCILNYSRPLTLLLCYRNRIDGLKGNGVEYPDG